MSQDLAIRIHVLVLSDSQETADLLVSLLEEEPGLTVQATRTAFGEGLKSIQRFEPQVAVVADTIDDPAAVIEALDTAAPGVPTIAILQSGDLRGAQKCNLAGARATLLKPFDQQNLVEAIHQVHVRESRRKQFLVSTLDGSGARQQRPRVIAVHGAKGGVGTTTVACNLAVALRQLTGRRVALVDADVLSGDAGVLFDLLASRSVADLLPLVKELDAELVDRLLLEHPSGVRVLLAPDQLHRAEAIGGEDVQRVIAGLKPYFDYQVVDTPSRLTPVTLAALDEADLVVLLVTPELAALRNAARFLQITSQFGYPGEKVLLVVNRANTGKDIKPAVVEEYFQRSVAASLPSAGPALVDAQNAGELIVATHPRNKVAEGVAGLARDIAAQFGWTVDGGRAQVTPVPPSTNGAASASPGTNGKATALPPASNGSVGTGADTDNGSAAAKVGVVAPRRWRGWVLPLLGRGSGRGATPAGQAPDQEHKQ